MRISTQMAGGASVLTLLPFAAQAQEMLPGPDPSFDATIGLTYKDSKPGTIRLSKAPPGAPNVVIVLLDDVGFGAAGTFGGPVDTPTLDRLAAEGLRYNAFHTTALCSPTRAALLTGRNHHSAGSGVITEMASGYDGYSSIIPRSAATIAEILRQNGYNTSAWGKWHNTPMWETGVSGPFDRWPTGLGFEKFYGFMGGESHQYSPELYDGTAPVDFPERPGYTLTEDLADKATDWMNLQKSLAPDKPFLVYWAPGATHAPHHVPAKWVEPFRGRFDKGWDALRGEIFARQKKLGVIPASAKLTPRPPQIPAWDSLTPERKKVAARLMETYAGFLAQTDHEVGRLLDALDQVGQRDNTLFFYIVGDNGASGEGSPYGVFDEMSILNGIPEDPSVALKHMDEIGGPTAYNHYPVGFAWAMDTPFQWTKQIASHLGGTRNAMVVAWPKRIKDRGGLRGQFHHCIDIAPTILEAAGIPAPRMVNGAAQKPIEGVSMLYTFDDARAKSRRTTQYFEMFGNRAIYKDGWMASTFHGKTPWSETGARDFDKDVWELYNIGEDYSQADDLSAKHPGKLGELQDLFWAEAARHGVLPLDDRGVATRIAPGERPDPLAGRTRFTFYPGAVRIPEAMAPNMKNTSHRISVDLTVPKGGADGVLVAQGGVSAGWALFVRDGKPTYAYNYFCAERPTITAKTDLPEGDVTVRYEFAYDGGGPGRGGIGALFVNGKKVGEGRLEKTVPGGFSAEETFDIGRDTGSSAGDYEAPFPFAGTIRKVEVSLGAP